VTMTAHLMHEVEPLRKRRSDGAISPALEAVVMRALSKSPAERQPSARAFAEALLAAKSDPLIINTTAPADALGDTDLNVASPALAEALARDAAMNPPPTSGRSETPVVHAIPPEPPPPVPATPQVELVPLTVRAGPRWLWIAVALIAALVGIGIGIVAGTR